MGIWDSGIVGPAGSLALTRASAWLQPTMELFTDGLPAIRYKVFLPVYQNTRASDILSEEPFNNLVDYKKIGHALLLGHAYVAILICKLVDDTLIEDRQLLC